MSFAGSDEPIELTPLEDFEGIIPIKNELIAKSKRDKDKKGLKRKSLEQSDKFLTTPSTSTVLMQNARRRSSSAPTPKSIEKQSKGNDSDDNSTEEQKFASLNDL